MKLLVHTTGLALLVATTTALAPTPAPAAIIDVSDVTLRAFTSVRTQGAPERTALDARVAPHSSLVPAEALSTADGIPFPNLPNSVNRAFASSAVDASGAFGVGVNGFFFRNSLPPNALVASGSFSETVANNSTSAAPLFVPVAVDFFIPIPTIQFFGVGNSFPAGVDPARDASAEVQVRMLTRLTHPDGSVVEDVALDYGMTTFREPVSGVLLALPHRDASGSLRRFDEPDGSFGFQLSDLQLSDFALATIGPGDLLEFTYEFLAMASTGFGETGIFAAIGDPFDLNGAGVRFDLQVGGAPASIPEPATWTLLAGAALFGLRRTRRLS